MKSFIQPLAGGTVLAAILLWGGNLAVSAQVVTNNAPLTPGAATTGTQGSPATGNYAGTGSSPTTSVSGPPPASASVGPSTVRGTAPNPDNVVNGGTVVRPITGTDANGTTTTSGAANNTDANTMNGNATMKSGSNVSHTGPGTTPTVAPTGTGGTGGR